MQPLQLDPMAGERARAIVVNPEVPRPVTDPTDPCWGRTVSGQGRATGRTRRVVDPTDPGCEARSA